MKTFDKSNLCPNPTTCRACVEVSGELVAFAERWYAASGRGK